MFVVTHFLPIPGTLHDVMRNSGGQKILDLQPTYSSDEVYQRLPSFGVAGKEVYLRMMLSMDLVFPLVFAAFLFLLALYTIGRTCLQRPVRVLLLLLPYGYLIPDLIENFSIAWLIHDYPNRQDALAGAIGYITLSKRISMYAAIILPLAILFTSHFRKRRGASEA